MARFNTTQTTISVTAATTLTYVLDKSIILLSGTAGYTLTLSTPVPFPGTIQSIYNSTGGNVTIQTSAGNIIGNGFSAATTQIIPNNTTYTLTSNGTNYIITNNEGGPISATTGAFSGALTANSTVSLSPANANVTASPTGSGTVTIAPATAGTIDNVSVGATTRAAGAFTTLNANSTVGLSPANANVTASPTGTGTVTVAPATAGTINNMSIGATTRAAGAFTTLASNAAVTMTGGTTSGSTTAGQLVVTGGVGVSENLNVGGTITSASSGIQNTPIGGTTRAAGAFTTLAANSTTTISGAATFSSTIIVPEPSSSTHASSKNYVDTKITWVTPALIYFNQTTGVNNFAFAAQNAQGDSISYSQIGGTLPGGMSLASNGLLSGTPSGASPSSFTLRATGGSPTQNVDRAFTFNRIIPPAVGQVLYEGSSSNTNGGEQTFTWVAPAGVSTVSVAVIGGGGGGYYGWAVCGGSGGGMAWGAGIPVTSGNSYTIQVGNGGCWSGSGGGYSCFPNFIGGGGRCGCCQGCCAWGGPYTAACGSNGMAAYNNTAGGGGGAGGYCNTLCNQVTSGHVGCHGGGGSAASHHSSTHGTGGGGGTGILGQGQNGACSNPCVGHGTSGGAGQGGSGGTCGKFGEPYSNGQGNGFACGGNYGGGGGGGGTGQGGGWGGKGAVRIIWGSGRAYPSTGTADQS